MRCLSSLTFKQYFGCPLRERMYADGHVMSILANGSDLQIRNRPKTCVKASVLPAAKPASSFVSSIPNGVLNRRGLVQQLQAMRSGGHQRPAAMVDDPSPCVIER